MEEFVIRKLVEKYTISELQEAEYAIIQEQLLNIEVEGKDEAEKLTHIIIARWVLEEMKTKDTDFKDAFSGYSKKVRVY